VQSYLGCKVVIFFLTDEEVHLQKIDSQVIIQIN